MARAIALRPDFSAAELRRLARRSKDAAQARRLLALAAVYDGGTRTEAARLGNVTLQIVRDWVMRFNAEGPEGLRDRKPPGPTPLLTDAHRRALAAQIDRGPVPAVHGVVRWRLCDLGQWLWEEFRVSVSMQTLSREVRKLGYRKLSARPKHHAQAIGAIETFKKNFPTTLADIARKQGLGLDVHRTAGLGTSVLISESWYQSRDPTDESFHKQTYSEDELTPVPEAREQDLFYEPRRRSSCTLWPGWNDFPE